MIQIKSIYFTSWHLIVIKLLILPVSLEEFSQDAGEGVGFEIGLVEADIDGAGVGDADPSGAACEQVGGIGPLFE